MKKFRTKYVCPNCGKEDQVRADALCMWNVHDQDWEIDVLSEQLICLACGNEDMPIGAVRQELTEEEHNAIDVEIIHAAVDWFGGCVNNAYSGRGMYGKKCLGIEVARNVVDEVRSYIDIRGVAGTRVDSMGYDYILYWPDIAGAPDAEATD